MPNQLLHCYDVVAIFRDVFVWFLSGFYQPKRVLYFGLKAIFIICQVKIVHLATQKRNSTLHLNKLHDLKFIFIISFNTQSFGDVEIPWQQQQQQQQQQKQPKMPPTSTQRYSFLVLVALHIIRVQYPVEEHVHHPTTCMALVCQGSEPCENWKNSSAALNHNFLKSREKASMKKWGWTIRRMKDGSG